MQKKLIALAVAAAAAAPAFAQSNVTVYGVVDAAYAHISADGMKTVNALASGGLSGSRIGFKGVEDLGNGLSALFVLEYGVDIDQNFGIGAGTSAGARQQLLGLTGAFGTVVAGRAQTAGYDFACATSAYAGSAIDGYNMVMTTKYNTAQTLSCGGAGRANNAFAYISPSFGGVTLAYNHSFQPLANEASALNSATNADNVSADLVGVSYAGGPVAARFVYSKVKIEDTALFAANTQGNQKEVGITGSYDLGVVKLFASYQTDDNTEVDNKNKKYGISATIPVGAAGGVHVGYAKSKLEEVATDAGAKAYTVAYTHGLSKRTTAYAGYTQVKNDTTATSLLNAGVAPDATNNGLKSAILAFGLRHTF